MSYDFLYKILLVGDTCVGKSHLMYKVCDNIFRNTYISTIGVDFRTRIILYRRNKHKIQLWDTAGQERFKTITSAYYRGAHGIIICFDTNNLATFLNVASWMSEINKHTINNCTIIIVGTKTDIKERGVPYDMVKKFADEKGVYYVEISSKEDSQEKIESRVLIPIIASIYKSRETLVLKDPSININKNTKKRRTYCN